MANEVLMVIKITIAMLGGNVFPVDVEMITTQEHCEQEIKNFNPIRLNFVAVSYTHLTLPTNREV